MLRKVNVKDIRANPFQARRTMDAAATKSLADEIKKVGLWPGALRGREKGAHVELCFGHRRLEAVKVLKWKEVDVDVVELSDEEMAMQALIENLQREGLSDADKADGIVAYIKLRQKSGNFAYAKLVEEIGTLLGYSEYDMNLFLRIAGLTEPAKEEIRAGRVTGRAADEARRLAGENASPEQVEKLIKNAAQKEVGAWPLQSMAKKLKEIPDDKVRERVRAKVIDGELTSPEEVVAKGRQFIAAQRTKDWKKEKPDLIDVIRAWTTRAEDWTKQLDEVIPYMDYIDQEPVVAKRWRNAVQKLLEKLQKFV
jgi:ParB/RepB/Spo0J family partition protein